MSKTHTKTNSGKSVRERLLNLSRAEHYKPADDDFSIYAGAVALSSFCQQLP